MRYFILLVVLMILSEILMAQINAGTAIVTGSIGFHTQSVESDLTPGKIDNSELNLQVGGGYFVGNNFALGINLGYETSEATSYISTFPDPQKQTVERSMVMVGPFVRLYSMLPGKAGFFGELDLNFGFGKQKLQDEPGVDISRLEAALRPGIVYFLSDKWAVEGKFGYLGYMQEREEYSGPSLGPQKIETVTSDLILSFNFATLNLGLAFYPGRTTTN